MTKVCTHGRGAEVAMQQLEESLQRLRTDHLDLWQIHECVYDDDPARHYAKGGVIEALERAKRDGKVRFVGFTGHKRPEIHREMIERGFPFDTAQMPLNVMDANYRSFEQNVLPLARERNIHALGMKAFAEGRLLEAGKVDPDDALRYAMSLPGVLCTITGIDTLEVLDHHVRSTRSTTTSASPTASPRSTRPRFKPCATSTAIAPATDTSSSTSRPPRTTPTRAAPNTASRR
jgi:aryl-alcohol dehydrogenase-like predicted oxidoreductase